MITNLRGGRQVEMRSFALTDMVSWGYGALRGSATTVSQTGAHGIPALYRAARMRAEAIATVDLCCWSGDGPDRRKRENVPQAKLFYQVPNPQQSKFNFWETVGESLAWRNIANIWLNTDPVSGRVLEWYALHPDQIEPSRKGWRVRVSDGFIDPVGNGPATYDVDERTLLRIRGHGEGGKTDPPTPIEVFREALQSPILRQRNEARMWRRGSSLQLAISYPQGVTQAQADEWRPMWRQTYEGADGETTAVVGGGAELKPIGMTAKDAEYVNMANLTVQDASMIQGVPVDLIVKRLGERTPPGALEEDLTSWFRFGHGPDLMRIESAIAACTVLFPSGSQSYPMFDAEGFVRGDVKTQDDVAHQQVQDGRLLVDEWRAQNGYPPLPNGLGAVPQVVPVGGAPNPNSNGAYAANEAEA